MPTTSRSGKSCGQGVERLAVGGVVEGRDEHQTVGDVEVGVAGRQPLAVEDDRLGHRQRDDAERLAVLVAGLLEPSQVLLQRLVIGVGSARLDDGDDGPGVDEPRQVVDVAVGVVADDPAAEPDNVPGAEVVGEDALEGRRGRASGCAPGPRRAGIPRWSGACPGR